MSQEHPYVQVLDKLAKLLDTDRVELNSIESIGFSDGLHIEVPVKVRLTVLVYPKAEDSPGQ
jgi:hypothetical protein